LGAPLDLDMLICVLGVFSKTHSLKKSESHIVGFQFPVAFREVVLKREGMLVVQLPLIVLDASLRRLHSTASVGRY